MPIQASDGSEAVRQAAALSAHEQVSELQPTQQQTEAEYKRLFGRFPRAVLCANKHETWDKARCVAIVHEIEMKLQVNRGSCC